MATAGILSLRLFVAGDSADSAIAIANLHALLPEKSVSKSGLKVSIEIIDVQREPARAARDNVMVTPTLLKVSPEPPCRILGNLRNRTSLILLLGLAEPDPA
ncbi:MAG: circadian clock KaiB family protein [Thermoanaerobaculia bacterium]